MTDGACSEDEIIQMELVVLKGLNWGLSPMTPNRWMKTYMQVTKNVLETSLVVIIQEDSQVTGNENLCFSNLG